MLDHKRIRIGNLVFILCRSNDDGWVLYTPAEWRSESTADYTADSEGRISFQGKPTGLRLTQKQMAGL